jgi:RNA polymerase sigma-70 factor (ECF subfamily)
VDERELVTQAQHGDENAFAALVRPHLDVSYRVAYLIAGGGAEAEDAVQDALVKAWRSLGRFRAGEPFRPWLLRIAANEARNRRRSARRRERLVLRAAAEPVAPPPDREGVLDALNDLSDDARTVVLCRYVLGLSEQETAAALDVVPGTVKSRTSRALERLRELHG